MSVDNYCQYCGEYTFEPLAAPNTSLEPMCLTCEDVFEFIFNSKDFQYAMDFMNSLRAKVEMEKSGG